MGFDWGSALTQLGKGVRGIGESYDTLQANKIKAQELERQKAIDEQDRAKRNTLLDLQTKDALLDYQNKQEQTQNVKTAYQLLKDYSKDQQDNGSELAKEQAITEAWKPNMTKKDVSEAGILGGIAAENYKPKEINYKDNPDIMKGYSDPGIKALVDAENKKAASMFSGGTATAQRALIMTDPELNDKMREPASKKLEAQRALGMLSDPEYALHKQYVEKFPAAYLMAPESLFGAVDKREINLEGKRREIPIEVEKAGKKTRASTLEGYKAESEAPTITGKTGAATAEQKKAASWAIQQEQAIGEIDNLEAKGYNPSKYLKTLSMAADKDGQITVGAIYRMATSTSDKLYANAILRFIDPEIRLNTGAAVTMSEFQNYGQMYMAQPFEPEESASQKRVARYSAWSKMKSTAGEDLYNQYKKAQEKDIKAKKENFSELKKENQPAGTGTGAYTSAKDDLDLIRKMKADRAKGGKK